MKKRLVLFLIMFMVFGTGAGFAGQEALERLEVDPRVKALRTGDFEPGDAKFLSDGNLAIYKNPWHERRVEVEKCNWSGDHMAAASYDRGYDRHNGDSFWGFLVEDASGNLWTVGEGKIWKITPDYADMSPVMKLNPRWSDAKSKDRVMINLINQDVVGYYTYFEALTYPEGKDPVDSETESYYQMSQVSDDDILSLLGIQMGRVVSVDFGGRADELYFLVSESTEMGEIWSVCPFTMTFIETADGDNSLELKIDETKEKIVLEKMPEFDAITTFNVDGDYIHVVMIESSGTCSIISRYDQNGKKTDTIQLPGYVFNYDTQGQKSVLSVKRNKGTELNGFYKIEWEPESAGSPRALIHERSFGEKTLATFRDGGYGLLKSEEPETGLVDYLAPLKTEEEDVRLRIPLCDLLAKVEGNARNLEILYGEEEIVIPMSALSVQNLLARMPCQTDATIEIHLERGGDGVVLVNAELFVVEQVDDMTKVVHRLPIVLP